MDDQIGTRISALEAELQSLKQMVEETDEQPAPATSDRRGMVKLLAAGAVGAVTGAPPRGPQPAAAANGSNAVLGVVNTSTDATEFNASGDSGIRTFGNPYGIESDGGTANALFSGSGPSPIGGAGSIGELYVDGQG